MDVRVSERWVDDAQLSRQAAEYIEGLVCHLALRHYAARNEGTPAGTPLPAPDLSVEQNKVP